MADIAQTAASPDSPAPARSTRPWPLIGTILLVAWSCLRFPLTTFTQNLDSSWAEVLVYAREKGLQFGRDIVWTYGPLGFFSTRYFSPYNAVVRIFFEIALAAGIATGLCLLAWRLKLPGRIALLAFFICLAEPFHHDGVALFLDTGILAWGLLCFLESGPHLRCFIPALVILAAVGALVKFTFLVTGFFTIVLLAGDFALRRRYAAAAGIFAGFIFAFLAGWTMLGQNLSNLGAFFSTSYSVADGYNAAMGKSSPGLAWVLIMALSAFAALVIRVPFTASGQWPQPRRGVLFLWLAGLVFVTWKYGCVRTDSTHVVLMLGVVPVIALALEALPAPGRRGFIVCSRAACIVCLAAAYLYVQGEARGFALFRCARETCQFMSANFAVLMSPTHYLKDQLQSLRDEQAREQFPKIRRIVGNATADIFGVNQGFAFPNDLNYLPPPVFQNYAAYNRLMLDLNEQFYTSAHSPDFVLFNLQAIDGWLPPLADSIVIRHLLANYALLGGEGDFLLFRRKTNIPVRLTLIKSGAIASGEKLDLSAAPPGALWLEFDPQPTLFGRVRNFLYKPAETSLAVWSGNATPPPQFRAPAAMLSAGFLARPLVLNNDDVYDLCTTNKIRAASAFSVEIPAASASFWQPQIPFRLYRIENEIPAKSR